MGIFLAMLKFNYCLLNWCEEMIIISRYTSLLVELNLIFISTLFSNGFVKHSVKLHCCNKYISNTKVEYIQLL